MEIETAAHPLQELREIVLMMAGLADRNFTLALRSVVEDDVGLAELTETEDGQIDDLEMLVDEMVLRYITRFRPVARDLRTMLVAVRAARDFERVGDLAVGIARCGCRKPKVHEMEFPDEFFKMRDLVLGLLRRAVVCLAGMNSEEVPTILEGDGEVNRLCELVSEKMLRRMAREPVKAGVPLKILLITQSLERIADHGKAIAEDVFYLARAVDIRHKNAYPFHP